MELSRAEDILGVRFKDRSLLKEALSHPSFSGENPGEPSYERLEFLGDAILNFIIAERLFSLFPNLSEGELTHMRSSLVKGENLSRVARKLSLGELLILGKGEDMRGGRDNDRTLASALEAVIGAIFRDKGYRAVRKFVLRIFSDGFEEMKRVGVRKDSRSLLQEIVQAERKLTPRYRSKRKEGGFYAEVFVGREVIGAGYGRSKKEAKRNAAEDALRKMGRWE